MQSDINHVQLIFLLFDKQNIGLEQMLHLVNDDQ
jgi:hypothetical protein